MYLRYNFRIYPTPSQERSLANAFGCARTVWNDGIKARRTARAEGLPFMTGNEMCKRLITQAKKTPERAWLSEVSAVILQSALRDLDLAYKHFSAKKAGKGGRRVGPPRMKSKKDARQSVRFTANAHWRITSGGKLRLPKIGNVPIKLSRPLPATASTVTVVKDSSGRYFASFIVQVDPDPLPSVEQHVGLDLGIGHFAVLSDGRKIDNPKFLRRAEKKLKRAHRDVTRKEKGSKNKQKAWDRLARVHARVADARRNFHHQLSTQLIRENQAIAVEDLPVRALARGRLAKSVHDAGWSSFVYMLKYKAERHGRQVIQIGRFEPTSQVCSCCGVKDGPKPLKVRVWTCGACGAVLDRDINAAVNVAKAAGLAVTACGAQVRPGLVPAPRSEAGTHSKLPAAQTATGAGEVPL